MAITPAIFAADQVAAVAMVLPAEAAFTVPTATAPPAEAAASFTASART
jgi:hypothetical protein